MLATSCFCSTALSSSPIFPLLLLLFFSASLSGFCIKGTRQPHWGKVSLLPPVPFRAAGFCQSKGSYTVPGVTLGKGLIWYTAKELLWQALPHNLLLFYGSVFFSSSSFLLLSLRCTASLWPAGLPHAIMQIFLTGKHGTAACPN